MAGAPEAQGLLVLAVMAGERGDLQAATQLLQQARAADPKHPEVLFRLGLARRAQGQEAEALACFDELLRLAPGNPAALNARGLSLKALGHHDDALAAFDQALARAPAFAEALNNRGVLLRALGRREEALASFEKASAAQPKSADILNNLGWTLHLLGRGEDALAALGRALALRPRDAQVLSNIGATLAGLGRYDEAVDAYEKALALDASAWQTWMNLGVARHEQHRGEEALAALARAEALAPGDASIALNRGNALLDLGRGEEAVAAFEAAAAAGAADAQLEMNLGNAWRDMQRPELAREHYERALALEPQSADIRFNYSLSLLAAGDWGRGWAEFESRFDVPRLGHRPIDTASPRWRGSEPLEGRTLVLVAEQGFGDTIQMCRYAALAAQRGARVVLAVQKPLVELLRASFAGLAEVVALDGPLPPCDFHCPLMSAPLAFGTTVATIPSATPYLHAEPARVERWRRDVPADRLNIGLAWSGNPQFAADHRRSIGLARLLDGLPDGPQYWCLQKDVSAADERLLGADGRIGRFAEVGFADTAAQAMLMDAVVASDTSIPHLTAALGRPTWLLLAHGADWRWMIGREDSPWYPSARLLRQPEPGDWASVLERVREGLEALLRERGGASA